MRAPRSTARTQLISDRKRRALAASLVRLLDEADTPVRPLSAAVPIQREAIRACRSPLLRVAEELEDTKQPVNAKGVLLVEQLLRDGDSPVYAPLGERALEGAVRARARRAAAGLMDLVAIAIGPSASPCFFVMVEALDRV